MPEGDTVHLAATRLNSALGGAILTKTDFRVPRFATVDLAGERVHEVMARGKHLLFRFSGGKILHTHFKMEGAWHLYRPGERWRGPGFQVRAVLTTEKWEAVGFRLGICELLDTELEHTVVGHLGPDVLGPDWDPEEVLRRMEKYPDRPIGDVLIDQTVLAGLGNIYRCELCFLRGLNPWQPLGSVTDLPDLVALTKRVMEANRATGMQITTGDRRPGQTQWVYGRKGLACRRCGTSISKRAEGPSGTRVTYWCSNCQPEGSTNE
jgi:formamidopyrimidine-DNA glycosylase